MHINGYIFTDTLDEINAEIDKAKSGETVKIQITSEGGDALIGIAIANVMEAAKARGVKIIAEVYGLAASAATLIVASATESIGSKNSFIQIHNAWSFMAGNHLDFAKISEALKSINESYARIYQGKMGGDIEEIKQIMDEDKLLTIPKAHKLKLIDTVTDALPIAAFAKYDFTNAPQEFAARFSKQKDTNTMSTTTTTTNAITKPLANEINPITKPLTNEITNEQSTIKERDRIASIYRAFSSLKNVAGINTAIQTLITDNSSVEKAQSQALEILAKQSKEIANTSITIKTGAEQMRTDIEAAIQLKLGMTVKNATQGAQAMRQMPVIEMARRLFEKTGDGANEYLTPNAIINTAFAQTTSDFPNILQNVANKSALQSWELATPLWHKISSVGSVSNFQKVSRVGLNHLNKLSPKTESGDYRFVSIDDRGQEIQARTKGAIIGISREALINDNLGLLTQIPQRFARSAHATIDDDVLAAIVGSGNGQLMTEDSHPLFHSSHDNISRTKGLPNADTLRAALILMSKQKSEGQNKYSLNIEGKILLLNTAFSFEATKLIGSTTLAGETNSGVINPYATLGLRIIHSSNIPENKWYLLADPFTNSVIETAFLNGMASPVIEQSEKWSNDQLRFKCRIEYGVAALDYRGFVQIQTV